MKISDFSKTDKILESFGKFSQAVTPFLGIAAAAGFTGLLIYGLIYNCSNKKYEDFAKKLVANDYPTLVCKSDSGKFRIYEQGTYSVAEQKAGWNVWWTDKGYSDATAFHVAKCDIKDELK